MSIEEYRAEIKDNYIAADVVCPHCGKKFQKHSAYHCPECLVKIFDRDENGWVVLIDPKTVDKSRKYKVVKLSEEVSEHFPGELVTINIPLLTDCNFSITADGIELPLSSKDGQLTVGFLMPAHDVKLEKSCVSSMLPAQSMNGFGNMSLGMSGMGNMSKT